MCRHILSGFVKNFWELKKIFQIKCHRAENSHLTTAEKIGRFLLTKEKQISQVRIVKLCSLKVFVRATFFSICSEFLITRLKKL